MKQFIFFIAALLLSFAANAQVGIVTTVAGDGNAGFGADNIPATSSSISIVTSRIAVDSAGNVYFGDSARIRKVDHATGIVTTIAGTGIYGFSGDDFQALTAQVRAGSGICIAKNGDMYFVDGMTRIRKITAAGIITTIAGTGLTSGFYDYDGYAAVDIDFGSLRGMTFDKNGNLLVADEGLNMVFGINLSTGLISRVAGNGGSLPNGDGGPAIDARIGYPEDICIDTAGNVYIVGSTGGIRKVTWATGIISTLNLQGYNIYGHVSGICSDSTGNLYFTDAGVDSKIHKIDVTGTPSIIMGNAGHIYNGENVASDTASLMYPEDIITDRCGNLFILERYDRRIRKVKFMECWPLEINDPAVKEATVSVYPNPANTELFMKGVGKGSPVVVYDVTGRVVLSAVIHNERPEMDIRTLPAGVYFVKAGGKAVRFVKE